MALCRVKSGCGLVTGSNCDTALLPIKDVRGIRKFLEMELKTSAIFKKYTECFENIHLPHPLEDSLIIQGAYPARLVEAVGWKSGEAATLQPTNKLSHQEAESPGTRLWVFQQQPGVCLFYINSLLSE